MYIFRILILGNPDIAIPYLTLSFNSIGEDKEKYIQWLEEIHVLDEDCDLEIDMITDMSLDFDKLIPTVDGIIYFLELILAYCSRNSALQGLVVSNRNAYCIFSAAWAKNPLSGNTPLNLENAWYRFPIFLQLANFHFNQNNYYQAAKSLKSAALIAELFGKEEYYVLNEQSAFLFYKSKNFLESAKILEEIEYSKSTEFKNLYVQSKIREAHKLFYNKEFESAAKLYENAAQWASIELRDKDLTEDTFKLAMNSWISACKVENAFVILERLPHEEVEPILIDVSDKILAASDYLISENDSDAAREQLYISIYTYQEFGLSDLIKKFTHKLTDLLIDMLKRSIDSQDQQKGRKIYDEIQNMWETYEVGKKNLDSLVGDLIELFLESYDFSIASYLINHLESLKLKKELTKLSSEFEEKSKKLERIKFESRFEQATHFIEEFQKQENQFISNLNKETLRRLIEENFEENLPLKLEFVHNHIKYLKNVGKNDFSDNFLSQILDLLIKSRKFQEFFTLYREFVRKATKKRYIIEVYPLYLSNLKNIHSESFEFIERIVIRSIGLYRDNMLYEESREISKLYIDFIKKEASKFIEEQSDKSTIIQISKLIKKAMNISEAYLDNFKPNFDMIYQKIAEVYLKLEEPSLALTYSDKVEDKKIKKELNEKIALFEEEKRIEYSSKIKKSLKAENLRERLSIIIKKLEDASITQERELKQRKGLKRIYYQNGLDNIKAGDLGKAIENYKETTKKLIKAKNYNLAGVSSAIVGLLLFKVGELDDFESFLNEIAPSESLFYESLPIQLCKFIIDLNDVEEKEEIIDALELFKNLPLFKVELNLLNKIIGSDEFMETEQKELQFDTQKFIKEIESLGGLIQKEKRDISKRKMMKSRFWESLLEELDTSNYLTISERYLQISKQLFEKRLYKNAIIGLIMSLIIQIGLNDLQKANKMFYELFEIYKPQISDFSELQLVPYIFKAYENDQRELIHRIIEIYLERLILFPSEINLLNNLFKYDRSLSVKKDQKKGEQSSEFIMELEQQISIIELKFKERINEFDRFFKKRKIMKKRSYEKVLIKLNNDDLIGAANEYLNLVNTFMERKDFKTSNFLILLHTLSLLKSEISPLEIEEKINSYFTHLGPSKRLLEDTFEVMLLLFLIKVKKNNLLTYNAKIEKILKQLPVFEEERRLTQLTL
ncbi:MAG: hypothetical protein P8Y70_08100 [Candidatus Lokiarchaeota archaeon]